MKTHSFALRTALGLLVGALAFGLPAAGKDKKAPSAKKSPRVQVGPYQLSGPHTCKNLTIFLIHGADQFKGKKLLTLQEAMRQKKIVVHETEKVNELSIENLSPDREIFVQSGDIVKGGQQDRTLAYDLVVPPRSGKIPVAAFCVEAGRWQSAGESATRFHSSPNTLTGKDKKRAIKDGDDEDDEDKGTLTRKDKKSPKGGRRKAQSKVWLEVARNKCGWARTLGKSVKAKESGTSLQLTLEDKKLLEAVDTYQKKLARILKGKKDVIGYAFAINGRINSADLYGSHHLFKKLWPNLLKATVVEALAELKKAKKSEPVGAEAFQAFMRDAEQGKQSAKEVSQRIRLVTLKTKKNVLYVTQDKKHNGLALRKNYFTKE